VRATADDDGDPRAIGLQDDEFVASNDEGEEEDLNSNDDYFDDEPTRTARAPPRVEPGYRRRERRR
jgi:hypothetical protein